MLSLGGGLVTYSIREMYETVQGEGANAGTRVVLVRFSGCNAWTGREEDRERDAGGARCAAWCDTEFRGTSGTEGGRYSAQEMVNAVSRLWGDTQGPRVALLTGGEPSLQVDQPLVDALHEAGFSVWVETNGSVPLRARVDWLCVSPKHPLPVLPQKYDEVKLVLPGDDPRKYAHLASRLYVQPLDGDPSGLAACLAACLAAVREDPRWRVSLQTHKMMGLP